MYANAERLVPTPGIDLYLDAREALHLLPVSETDLPRRRIDAPLGRPLLDVLDGGGSDDVSIDVAARIADLLDELEDEGYLLRERDVRSADTAPWERQVAWFAQETGDGPERQFRLGTSVVLVLGLGGVGSAVAELLARAGVGTLVLVDPGAVEPGDLASQQLFAHTDLGHARVDAARDRLASTAPGARIHRSTVRITGAADVAELLDEHDPRLIVCAPPDHASAFRTWVEDAASRAGVAVIHGRHRPPLAVAGPMFVPGLSCCDQCFTAARVPDALPAAARRATGHGAPTTAWGESTVASLVAGQAINWLAGVADAALLGRELQLDLRTLTTRWNAGPDIPMCTRCDGTRSAQSHR